MAKLILYDSLHNKMVFNMQRATLSNIVAGKNAGISYIYGACNVLATQLSWSCGTYYTDFDIAYIGYLKQYQPYNMDHQTGDPLQGFTLTQLIGKGWYTENTLKTFYFDNNLTDYVSIRVNTGTVNSFGTKIYTQVQFKAYFHGVSYSFIDSISTNVYDLGLAFGTYNGITGFFPFICNESMSNTHRIRSTTIYLSDGYISFVPFIEGSYDYYAQAPNEIPVDASSAEPAGGWSNILSDLTGDDIDLPDAPDETVSGVLASGFLNIYSPTASQLQSFGGALWTNAFNVKWYDLDSVSNLILNTISDPINFIVGLFMLPVTPTTGNASGVYLGGINVNSITVNRVTKQYVTIDFGTIDINELYASYLDYTYSRLSIYLPYIGMADIDVQEVTGGSVTLQYIIDCFTGACVANVKCVKNTETPWGGSYVNSTVHSYSGNVALQLPISAGSFDVMTQGLINVGLGLVSGQPQSVVKGANEIIQNVGGDSTTRGSLSSNTGRLCYQTPYLMFTRPIESRPVNLNSLHGISAGIGGVLSSFKGYVECSDVKLDGVTATDTELNMIESLLKSGVYV